MLKMIDYLFYDYERRSFAFEHEAYVLRVLTCLPNPIIFLAIKLNSTTGKVLGSPSLQAATAPPQSQQLITKPVIQSTGQTLQVCFDNR